MSQRTSKKTMPPHPLLPQPSATFTTKKQRILSHLAQPDEEYTDLSPKGSVDEGVRELIAEINGVDGLVTTSSCAGRVSVFLEGRKKGRVVEGEGIGEGGEDLTGEAGRVMQQEKRGLAATGGKGGGGTWLFVSHDPMRMTGSTEALGGLLRSLYDAVDESQEKLPLSGEEGGDEIDITTSRLIHFKFEPMILHILTASPSHAQLVIRAGLAAGFRETGAVSLLPSDKGEQHATPVVAVRSMGLGLESIIGAEDPMAKRKVFVTSEYMKMLVKLANERFAENQVRIERFRTALEGEVRAAVGAKGDGDGKGGEGWEDAGARRERKKREGLERRAEVSGQRERRQQDDLDVAIGGLDI